MRCGELEGRRSRSVVSVRQSRARSARGLRGRGVAEYKALRGLRDAAHALWGSGFVAVRLQAEAVLKCSSVGLYGGQAVKIKGVREKVCYYVCSQLSMCQ